MDIQDQPDETRFTDRGDWPQAVLSLIFLIAIPIAVMAMILASRELMPLKFVVPFAVGAAWCSYFLLKEVVRARTRDVFVDNRNGTITVRTLSPFQNASEQILPDAVDCLVFKTHENEGFWYKAALELQDSRQIVFAQGSNKRAVRARLSVMAEALVAARSNLAIRFIRTGL